MRWSWGITIKVRRQEVLAAAEAQQQAERHAALARLRAVAAVEPDWNSPTRLVRTAPLLTRGQAARTGPGAP